MIVCKRPKHICDIKFHFSLWKGPHKTQGKAYKKATNHIQGTSICILNLILNSFLLEFIFFHWHLHICKWLFRGRGLLVNLRPGICACQDNQTASRSNCAKISLFNYQSELTCFDIHHNYSESYSSPMFWYSSPAAFPDPRCVLPACLPPAQQSLFTWRSSISTFSPKFLAWHLRWEILRISSAPSSTHN